MSARAAAALAALALTAGAPEPGQPPLTPQTMRSGGPRDPDQLALKFDSADLSFEVLPKSHQLRGTAILSFTARAPLDRLVIDLDRNLGPQAVAIDGVALPRTAYANPQGQLVVTLPRRYAAGEAISARISFGGTPHVAKNAPWDDGVVWSTTRDGRLWFATTTEAEGCDLLWPCLDFPQGEPERVTLRITVPAGLKAPSNGVLKSVDTLPDGRTTWTWITHHPNTYAIALNVAPFAVIEGRYRSRFGNTIPMFYWYLPGDGAEARARALFAEFTPTLDFFERTIGPYPFGDEKVGAVESPYRGMEHQTINAYGNAYAKAPEGFDWLFQHEFSHEWFGNQMTAADWDDYWLHEGYGEYMQPAYGRYREGWARYSVLLEPMRNQIGTRTPLVSGRSLTQLEVYDVDRGGPGTNIYYKGAWMLHTLRYLIGEQAFWEVTRRLVYGRPDPRPGNFSPRYATSKDYVAIVGQVTGRDHRWFFDVYLYRAALPDLIVKREGDRLTLGWQAPDRLPFPMPVEVQIDDQTRRIAVPAGGATVTVPADALVTVDPWSKILRRSAAIEEYRAWRTSNVDTAR